VIFSSGTFGSAFQSMLSLVNYIINNNNYS
jgi:hypothetical protein